MPASFIPPSIYLLRKLTGAGDWSDYEVHVCAAEGCAGHVFPPLPLSEWAAHQDDTCIKCGSRRFKVTRRGGRERLEPAHWYIDFGLENVIREQLFRDERFLKERGNHRMNNPATGESPYQGEAYAELLQKTGGKAGRWESSLVELMFDSVQPFRKASHSSTILSVRYMDVDPRNRGKAWASAVVAVIPGPSIPKAMRAYLLRTVAALQRLAEDGMEVTQPRTIGTQHDPAFKYKHHVYLWGALADTPARCKLGCFAGVGAYEGACSWCKWRGELVENTVRYLGYSTPRHQPAIGRAVRVGDARLHLTHADQVERGQVADALVLRAHGLEPGRGAADRRDAAAALSAYPVKASNPFTALSYVDLQDMFRVPVVHALLYGVVRAFVLCMLDGTAPEALAFTRDDKRLIQSRASRVVVPSDFGRPYLDLVDYHKSWRMEDWLHFVRTFAPFIFRDVLRGAAQAMWQKLTDAVCHYFTPLLAADRATFLASASAAHRRLCEFAKLAEENTFPDKTFSVNLHICCCRLLRQEQRVGAAAGDLEFAVERVMQYYKRVASGVAYKPEQHFANEVLLTGAMAEVRAQHSLLSLEDVAGRRQADFSDVQRFDQPVGGVLLKGVRGRVTDAEAEDVLAAVQSALSEDAGLRMWCTDYGDLDAQALLGALRSAGGGRFTRAEVGEELLYSSSYGRIQTRESHNVLLRFDTPGPRGGAGRQRVPYIASIRFFAKIPSEVLGTGQVGPCLKLAICTLTEATEEVDDALFLVQGAGVACWPAYAVRLELLHEMHMKKLVKARPPIAGERVVGDRGQPHPEARKTFYMPYVHVTERAD